VEVVPELDVFPPSLLIEAGGAGATWKRRLRVESRRELPGEPSLQWSEEWADSAIHVVMTRTGERSWAVELTGAGADLGSNAGRASLTLTFGQGQFVSVPIQFVAAPK